MKLCRDIDGEMPPEAVPVLTEWRANVNSKTLGPVLARVSFQHAVCEVFL